MNKEVMFSSLTKAITCSILLFLLITNAFLVLSQSEEWLSIEDEHFIIKYKAGKEDDAKLMLEYCKFAHNVTMEVYPHELDVKVTVYLYDNKSWTRSPYSCWADATKAEIHFLTPSDVPGDARRWVDNLWYQKNVVHEYVHIPTIRDLWKTEYYYSFGAPDWFDEGIAEYISVFCTTEEILQKYEHYARNMRTTVINGSVFFEDYELYR